MTDLVGFLRARHGEDEQVAREASTDGEHWSQQAIQAGRRTPTHYVGASADARVIRSGSEVARSDSTGIVRHIARHDPARALREVERDRRVVDLHGSDPHECPVWDEPLGVTCTSYELDCLTLRLLALPYADHPDYREEWRA